MLSYTTRNKFPKLAYQKMDFVSQSNSATDAAGNLILKHYSNMVFNI